MAKASHFGMAFHQALGFSAFLMRVPHAEAVFWPGCALLNLDGEILEKTLEILRRAEPDIQLACGCCGQPTVYLFPEKAEKRKKKLISLLERQGVRQIYTACPNCTLQLRELDRFEILPIWPVLAEQIRKTDLVSPAGQFIWHDPCPTRQDPVQQEAARKLLETCGCDCCQPEHTGCKTRCCGNFRMMAARDPETSRKMRLARLEDFSPDRTVASSCEGCLGAFRSEGRQTRHLLELLFGTSQGRSWINRIRTTRK